MKHKTAELTNDLLDAAVARAEGYNVGQEDFGHGNKGRWLEQWPDGRWNELRSPSTDWDQGGPIMEREHIVPVKLVTVTEQGDEVVAWHAFCMGSGMHYYIDSSGGQSDASGPTPLIAVMRAYVASKLGDEVEL